MKVNSLQTISYGAPEIYPKISVIIRSLNDEEDPHHLLPRIAIAVYEGIVVDGCSTDNSVGVIKQFIPATAVVLQEPKGGGNALTYGAKMATGDYLLFLDAHGSQQPAEIPLSVEKARTGHDMVKESRFLPEEKVSLRRF